MNFVDEIIDNQQHWSKTAIVMKESRITYRQLRDSSYQLANTLAQYQIAPGSRVLILLEKSIEALLCFFAVMKAGATFVPLDTSLPVERIRYIISNCAPQLIITNATGLSRVESLTAETSIKTLVLADGAEPPAAGCVLPGAISFSFGVASGDCGAGPAPGRKSPGDIAYIIYTSGSTGRPKGVMIRQESFTRFVEAIAGVIPYYRQDMRYLSLFPFHFDASLCDIYPTLLVGGTLVLMENFLLPNQLLEVLEKQAITLTCMSSTTLKMLVSRYSSLKEYRLPKLEALWYGTESCPSKTLKELARQLPGVQFIHSYGPTEATCTSHVYFCRGVDDQEGVFPIGQPLPTVTCYALNDAGEPIRPGEVGELYLSGIQVMQGYCGDPETTARVLIRDALHPERLTYRTGDHVTVDQAGNYTFVGRRDDMIKSCGKLVHVSEIETVLLESEKVKDAIVLPYADELQITRMIAFIVPKPGRGLSREAVESHLLEKLPQYMVPHQIRFITEEIPRNSNGKVDKARLFSAL